MIVGFAYADKPRERVLVDAFGEGLDGEVYLKFHNGEEIPDVDVCCMVGVKSKDIFYECIKRGITPVMFDKGYVRHAGRGPLKLWEYWRVSVGAHHPADYVAQAEHSSDRFEKLKIGVKPWRKRGKDIVLAGSSAKYHEFYKLRDPTTWNGKQITEIKKYTNKRIIYRPKPSWRDAQSIPGTIYSNSHTPAS